MNLTALMGAFVVAFAMFVLGLQVGSSATERAVLARNAICTQMSQTETPALPASNR